MRSLPFLRRGQITVFVLLLGLLGLTIGLSAASRSLSDLKQATYVETGTKALAGAEAGLQYALSQLNSGSASIPASGCSSSFNITSTVNLTDLSSITYKICTQAQSYFSSAIATDDVLDLDVSKINTGTVKSYRISWTDASAALEIAYLGSNFSISRYAVNGNAHAGNNFLSSNSGSGGCGASGAKYVDVSSGTGGLLLRVKPLYASSTINVCGLNASSTIVALDANYYSVEVVATTTSGTVKRLSSKKSPSGLPSVFDNALFSTGNI